MHASDDKERKGELPSLVTFLVWRLLLSFHRTGTVIVNEKILPFTIDLPVLSLPTVCYLVTEGAVTEIDKSSTEFRS